MKLIACIDAVSAVPDARCGGWGLDSDVSCWAWTLGFWPGAKKVDPRAWGSSKQFVIPT